MNNQELLLKLVGLQSLFQELVILDLQMQQKQEIYANTKYQHLYTKENSQFQELLDGNSETIQEETIVFSIHQHQKSVPKLSSTQKNARFAEACREALKHFHPSAIVEDHKQLCAQVDTYLETYSSKTFWSHVQTTIPEKTTTQLKEYFQKCFSKVKYEESISEEDKAVLKELSSQMKDCRPAQVTDHFIKCRQSNPYFKRTIIMFVISLRK
ncbi:Hypothetical_protein [Hexamita inflata]|uniref:Hypothetical_protein n=1 Tax=Hexamita inflata TaxID=28002 RepID=A0AA86U5R2_9EUKA|nr:Hypothetical protein HINF_LOCUS29639 [Hexamita inflata]CAI9942000.1 Hypothetical protein HINF_LOCUS29645 [Hexamita inflata]